MHRPIYMKDHRKKLIGNMPKENSKVVPHTPFKIILPDRVINADGTVRYFKKKNEN